MAETVGAVIVGGGIAGASAAYWLAREGVRNVLVLERSAVAAGASGRASGLAVFLTTGHPGMAAVLKASADLYHHWIDAVGGSPALDEVGALLPVADDRLADLTHEVDLMRAAGHAVRLLDRDALAALVPDWNLDGVACAAHSPRSGYIDPPMVTSALINRARALGVRVYQGAEVGAIETAGGRVSGVRCTRGTIAAPLVVLAVGAWSAPLLRSLGLEVPVWPMRHRVLHLRPPAEMRYPFPMCADRANDVYFRPERGGLVLAANSGPDEPADSPEHFDPGVDDGYARRIHGAIARRIPAMRAATVVGGHAGVYAATPDEFPILGPVPGIEGLYCIGDTAGNGMTSSPGLGRALAEMIVRGATFTDIDPFRPSRFAEGQPIAVPYRHAGDESPVRLRSL